MRRRVGGVPFCPSMRQQLLRRCVCGGCAVAAGEPVGTVVHTEECLKEVEERYRQNCCTNGAGGGAPGHTCHGSASASASTAE